MSPVNFYTFTSRTTCWTSAKPGGLSETSRHRRGWPALYEQHVLQAPEGADFDFLVPRDADQLQFVDPIIGRS